LKLASTDTGSFTAAPAVSIAMQFVRYTRGTTPQWGVRDGGDVHALSAAPGGEPDLRDIANESYRGATEAAVERGALPTVPEAEVSLLAPVPSPGKIVCVGMNYRDHAEEQGEDPPETPMLFGKAATAVTNPGDPIVHPAGEDVDYEVELGVVIGREARNVARGDAADYVAGYTVLNDVSGREAQMGDGQFFRGKSYDTFAPMGPAIVADDEFDPNAADVECRVNGEVRQSSNTEQFVFDVHDLIEFASDAMTLRPGDVISTGTPGGVGVFMDPPNLLEPGDVVECEVEGIGVLSNRVVAE
jgi:2-keto-4-pentenoate hydratase/2-oxohepta-3-ene-1,7-dioic acid hydratase in catechol pathway